MEEFYEAFLSMAVISRAILTASLTLHAGAKGDNHSNQQKKRPSEAELKRKNKHA